MKRVLFLSGLVVVTNAAYLLAQFANPVSNEAPKTGADPFIAAPATTVAVPVIKEPHAPNAPLTPTQKRFLDLSEKKAQMLQEQQLQSEIGALEREVEGLNANVRLDEAVKVLQAIADKHYQTQAGRAAIAGLRAINQIRRPSNLPEPLKPSVDSFVRPPNSGPQPEFSRPTGPAIAPVEER